MKFWAYENVTDHFLTKIKTIKVDLLSTHAFNISDIFFGIYGDYMKAVFMIA